MLKKDPAERIRIGLDMTSHPYFAGVYAFFIFSRAILADYIRSDWEAMRNRTVLPPWVPDFVKGHHFFEDWGTIEHFVPGSAPSKDDEAALPDFAYTSHGMQYNDLKDTLDCTSPNLGRNTSEESLNGSFPSDPQQGFAEDLFGHLFASAYEDDLNEDEELWTFDNSDDHLPVNVVKVHSPTVSTPDSHTHILSSFHSGSSLLDLVESECLTEPEPVTQTSQPVICHTPKPVAVQAEHNAEAALEPIIERTESNAAVEDAAPELTKFSSLTSSGSLVEPLVQFSPPVTSQAEPVVDHTNVITVPESTVEISRSNVILRSPVPRLLQFATLPSAELAVDFTRPTPFQAVLEPLLECPEPTFEPTPTSSMDYHVPEEQIARENRAVSLYNKVASWLKKLLPWSKKREGASGLTIPSCEDMTLWESIRWKFQKMWIPKVKHNQRLQRKRTILF